MYILFQNIFYNTTEVTLKEIKFPLNSYTQSIFKAIILILEHNIHSANITDQRHSNVCCEKLDLLIWMKKLVRHLNGRTSSIRPGIRLRPFFIRGWTARFVNRPPMRNYPGPPFKSIHNFHSLTYGRIDGPRTAVYVLLLRHRCFIDDVACDSNQKALKPAHLT